MDCDEVISTIGNTCDRANLRSRMASRTGIRHDHVRRLRASFDAESTRVGCFAVTFFCRPPQGPTPRSGRAPRSRRRCACAARRGQTTSFSIVRRVEALGKFLSTDDGKSLLAGYKRAANILRIEEKKDGITYHGKPDSHLYLQPEERQLATAINAVKEEAAKAVAREDFEGAMAVIARLRPDVDAFFEKVTVNVPAADRRENRLKLLNEIREATRAVADFSRIEG